MRRRAMVLPRFAKSLALLVVGLLTAAACSGAPENAAETSEALGGPVCPTYGCAQACYNDASCYATPSSWAAVTGPYFGAGTVGAAESAALENEMIAAGCTAPILYRPCTNGAPLENGTICTNENGDLWPVSECPAGVSADIAAYELRSCDQCTGRALPDHILITWRMNGSSPAGCHSPAACNL